MRSLVVICLVISTTLAVGASPKDLMAPEPVKVTDADLVATRSGSIVLKVEDFPKARERVMAIARRHGAELRQADSEVNMAGEQHGELTLQVEAPKLDALMDDVRRVGKLYSERVQTNDRTSYYQTLERRADLLRRNESELKGLMHSSRRMRGSDLLFVQYRLYQTRAQEADAAQARLDLARGSRKSALQVMLFEPQPKRGFDWKGWHAAAVYRSKGSFFDVSRKLLTAGYTALWFAPLWLPALVVLFFLVRWVWRRSATWYGRWTHRYDRLPEPQE